jgi:hypothetical protein
VLQRVPGVKKVAVVEGDGTAADGQVDGHLIHVHYEEARGASVTDVPNILVNAGFRITRFSEEAVNLETAFMRLTKGLVQ